MNKENKIYRFYKYVIAFIITLGLSITIPDIIKEKIKVKR